MNTTRITRTKAIIRVTTISLIPAVMGSVVSKPTSYFTLSGKFFERTSISAITFLAKSTAFDPGAWYNAIIAHVCPFVFGIML